MPEKIGRYEITGELGKGAMGVVYKAIDPNIGRPVALKTMRVDVHGSDMQDMLRRFQNEARAAGVLNHPNIVTIYDAGEDQGVFYIAMEFIPGKTLAQLLAESGLAREPDAVIAANLSQRAAFWKLRDEMSAAQKPEGGSIKHDISVPVAAVPEFIAEANAAVVKLVPGSRPVAFGHLGDGNIHYNVSQPPGANSADFLSQWHAINAVVFDIVLRMGGSISAEHGIGVLKRDELPDVKDRVAIELMRAIKALLDPLGIMNPGKVL